MWLDLTTELNLDVLLHSIVSRAMELLDCTVGGLYLYRPDQDALELAVVIGMVDIYADHMAVIASIDRIEKRMVQHEQRWTETEHRLDNCAERVTRLQAFIEFRK